MNRIANFIKDAGRTAGETARSTAISAAEKANSASDAIQLHRNSHEEAKYAKYAQSVEPIRAGLAGTDADYYLSEFEKHPKPVTESLAKKAKTAFPIPKEQTILWLDAEFDLRPSGIALTDKGVFIKTDVDAIQFGKKSAKAALYYYRWECFSPSWFSEFSEENLATLVDSSCCQAFIDACSNMTANLALEEQSRLELEVYSGQGFAGLEAGVVAAAAALSAQSAVFVEQKAEVNLAAGHGEMAEEAINMLDRLNGIDAYVVGRDNARNGADRKFRYKGEDIVFIQTKYHNKWRSSLESCFDPNSGNYRYMNDDKPMQLEVPKDQYRQVLEGFKTKIRQGKVPGVTDPDQANVIVREGRLTYDQAKNLTRPGTVESLQYDVLTGVITCSCAFGITFVATTFLTWRKTGDMAESVRAGVVAGVQVFGLSFLQHMLVSQTSRTSLAKSLAAPSELLVTKLGPKATQTIVNGLRTLAGKSPIYGAAATKHLAKIARSSAITTAITLVVFSVPETYNLASRKISAAQYSKNLATLAGSVAAGAGGAVAAGVAAAKIAGTVGTAVAPGVGTAVGVAGGFVGGAIGGAAVGAVGGILKEDDAEATGRLFNAVTSVMISEYLLDEKEIDCFVKEMDGVDSKRFKKLFENAFSADNQERVFRDFLDPILSDVVSCREPFVLPEPEVILSALEEAARKGENQE
ncbi:hypothetical protein [Gordonibacter urolithinfaciens]|uniref:hypothetical protein n=1 Tax=Gordonibacter urolithinfaciens TaxID=1335613 RepID=UPI0034B66B61